MECGRCASWRQHPLIFVPLLDRADDVTRDIIAHEGICPSCGGDEPERLIVRFEVPSV